MADRLTYTLDEACARLGITTRTAHRLLAVKEELHPSVPAVRIGGRWKIPCRALDALLCLDGDERVAEIEPVAS